MPWVSKRKRKPPKRYGHSDNDNAKTSNVFPQSTPLTRVPELLEEEDLSTIQQLSIDSPPDLSHTGNTIQVSPVIEIGSDESEGTYDADSSSNESDSDSSGTLSFSDDDDDDIFIVPTSESNVTEIQNIQAPNNPRTRRTRESVNESHQIHNLPLQQSYSQYSSLFQGPDQLPGETALNNHLNLISNTSGFSAISAQNIAHSAHDAFSGYQSDNISENLNYISYSGSFDKFKLCGRNHKRWLVVAVLDNSSRSMILQNEILSDPSLAILFTSSTALFVCHAGSPRCQRFASYYFLSQLPHIAILDPETFECIHYWNNHINSGQILDKINNLSNNPRFEWIFEKNGVPLPSENVPVSLPRSSSTPPTNMKHTSNFLPSENSSSEINKSIRKKRSRSITFSRFNSPKNIRGVGPNLLIQIFTQLPGDTKESTYPISPVIKEKISVRPNVTLGAIAAFCLERALGSADFENIQNDFKLIVLPRETYLFQYDKENEEESKTLEELKIARTKIQFRWIARNSEES